MSKCVHFMNSVNSPVATKLISEQSFFDILIPRPVKCKCQKSIGIEYSKYLHNYSKAPQLGVSPCDVITLVGDWSIRS